MLANFITGSGSEFLFTNDFLWEKKMPRARNKEDLLQFSEENYSKLLKMISAMSENQMSTEFDFSDDSGKKEAHWVRDKNVRDVLIHLYEWHQLLIKFVEHNTTVLYFALSQAI